MLRYKMLARDINANPSQYRTWIVNNDPDFTGQYYTGLKSGRNPFVDTATYAINDDSVIADFNMPLPTTWFPPGAGSSVIRKTLPAAVCDSQLAIIDGYAYLFGTENGANIYRASLNNPADWIDTGATLPTPLYGSSLAIVGSTIYLFGGDDGYSPVNTIFSAPVSNPLVWTNTGSTLPRSLGYSSLGMYGGHLYLFGGKEIGGASNAIFTASTSSPLVWTDTGSFLPAPTYGACVAQVDGYWTMYGGFGYNDGPTNTIWEAPIASPTVWTLDGYLPYPTAFCQFFSIGTNGYLVGPMDGALSGGFISILQCSLTSPGRLTDTALTIPGVISHSQVAIIADRVWLFGGSGSSSIFACEQDVKYDIYDPTVISYGNTTRTFLQATDNINSPFLALGMAIWKTDYTL